MPEALAFRSSCQLLLHPTEEMAQHPNLKTRKQWKERRPSPVTPKSHVPGSKGTVLVDTRIEGPQHECLSLGSPVR